MNTGVVDGSVMVSQERWTFKWWLLGVLVVILGLGAGSLLSRHSGETRPSAAIHSSYGIDVSDKRVTVGFATNVFVGRVLAGVTHALQPSLSPDAPGMPVSIFEVEVMENIKGEVAGVVTVMQDGGYNIQGELVLVDGDPLLTEGADYVLATHDGTPGVYHLVAPRFDHDEVTASSEGVDIIQEWRDAYVDMIPFVAPGTEL